MTPTATLETTDLIAAEPVEKVGEAQRDGVELAGAVLEDLLVEEVSIDGMCGVY